MPVYAVPSLSPEAERAINVLGANAARLAVLSFISAHPKSLVSEITKGTGLTHSTVKQHVSSLTAAGVLNPDPDPSVPYADRRGRHTRYEANAERLAEDYLELGKLLGLR
ncbi:winged helix-turn-helix transcriptional regulator [Microbacterium sp. ISL-59]|uniref:ArsR/SmtB family transcription factor n=1 Tax=Microbacterium sp. ISL-59 TaxID=2819159 RepID=UPI001BE513CC|nr:winged helix-turn-helix domain-containing protein [Microbacterium sp. ISL-59]MBT2497468.1 winged helix-turn-helix transcriptional regulator [Microbacterium sp. ISL-59]